MKQKTKDLITKISTVVFTVSMISTVISAIPTVILWILIQGSKEYEPLFIKCLMWTSLSLATSLMIIFHWDYLFYDRKNSPKK